MLVKARDQGGLAVDTVTINGRQFTLYDLHTLSAVLSRGEVRAEAPDALWDNRPLLPAFWLIDVLWACAMVVSPSASPLRSLQPLHVPPPPHTRRCKPHADGAPSLAPSSPTPMPTVIQSAGHGPTYGYGSSGPSLSLELALDPSDRGGRGGGGGDAVGRESSVLSWAQSFNDYIMQVGRRFSHCWAGGGGGGGGRGCDAGCVSCRSCLPW
jgi:hypothetical protein